jgi:hypothetical protein
MKTSKLLKKTEELLSAKKSKQRDRIDSLKEILGQLKKRKRKLREKLKTEKRTRNLERIHKDLAVIRAQRKKGLKALKDL